MELSKQALDDLKFLGNFGECADGESFKGNMLGEDGEDTRVYLYEPDFRNLARSCEEVANYLATKKG